MDLRICNALTANVKQCPACSKARSMMRLRWAHNTASSHTVMMKGALAILTSYYSQFGSRYQPHAKGLPWTLKDPGAGPLLKSQVLMLCRSQAVLQGSFPLCCRTMHKLA